MVFFYLNFGFEVFFLTKIRATDAVILDLASENQSEL